MLKIKVDGILQDIRKQSPHYLNVSITINIVQAQLHLLRRIQLPSLNTQLDKLAIAICSLFS